MVLGRRSYDKDATKDDGSCLFPGDMLIGSWNVTETVSGNTATFTATIQKVDDNNIRIYNSRSNPPVYYLAEIPLTVMWDSKLLDWSGTTVEGTILTENDFSLEYLFGGGGGIYQVKLHYTR